MSILKSLKRTYFALTLESVNFVKLVHLSPPHFVFVMSIVDGEGFVALEFRKVDKGVVVDVALVENGIHLFP